MKARRVVPKKEENEIRDKRVFGPSKDEKSKKPPPTKEGMQGSESRSRSRDNKRRSGAR